LGRRIISNPAITATKLRPFNRKHQVMPTCAMRNPATAGPTTRAPLKMELLSEIAFIRSSRLVISTMNACRAGMSKAIATPPSAASTRMCHVWMRPLQTNAANINAVSIIPV
jgi:hypothetical protein